MNKLFAFVLSGLLLSTSSAFAFAYRAEDILGQLRIASFADKSVLANIDVRKWTPQDNVLGPLVADVDLYFKGQRYTYKKCSAVFNEEELSLGILCGDKVVRIILSDDIENMLSYVNGNFSAAKFTYVTVPLTEQSEQLDVEVKNLRYK